MAQPKRHAQTMEKVFRRTRVYRGRVRRLLTRERLNYPCVYMHIPKCGGTSLSEGLYALIPLDEKIGILDSPSIRQAMGIYYGADGNTAPMHDEGENTGRISAFREQLLLTFLSHGCSLVHGHFLFSEKAFRHFGERYRFATMMRDPIERTVSNYRMALRSGNVSGSLSDFLSLPMGRRMALHNLRYLSGEPDPREEDVPALMRTAEQNLARFSVIGFIDDPESFLTKFEHVFGRRPTIGHRNRAGNETVELTAEERRAMERLCGPDIALYETARTLAR